MVLIMLRMRMMTVMMLLILKTFDLWIKDIPKIQIQVVCPMLGRPSTS